MSDECDADIDGGCGACEKCDPEFWLQKSKERIAELEAENARLRGALREIMETDSEHLSYRIARRTLAASVGKYAGQPEHEAAGWQPEGG